MFRPWSVRLQVRRRLRAGSYTVCKSFSHSALFYILTFEIGIFSLSNLFNSLPRISPLRRNVYLALLNLASERGDLDVLQVVRTDVHRWLAEWEISDDEKSAFLNTVAEAFHKSGDM
jgi:hypothetical protein